MMAFLAAASTGFSTSVAGPRPRPALEAATTGAGRLDGWAFGCDVCNAVCPWNERFARATAQADYQPRPAPDTSDPGYFERMGPEEFEAAFGDTPLARAGLEGMRRNWRAAWRSDE
jgi:epoxyqueuosine reductase